MNVFAKFCCYVLLPYYALAVVCPPTPIKPMANGLPDASGELRFNQKLDHFKYTDTRMWGQRYMINYDYYKGDGPVFLVAGSQESNGLSSAMQSGAYNEYAKQMNALVLGLEHRYFGQSIPSDDLSTDSLQYLNNEQALADLASFISGMRKDYPVGIPSTAKWIAFGASRGGTLAARLKSKYPHLVQGAVSSSGPLVEKTNFNDYFTYMDEELEKMSPGAPATIKDAYQMINTAVNAKDYTTIEQKFKLSDYLDKNDQARENTNFLFWTTTNLLSMVVQYGNYELAPIKQDVLNKLSDASQPTSLDRLANAVDVIRSHFGSEHLLADYSAAVEQYKNPALDAEKFTNFQLVTAIGNRQTLYLTYTEYGQFQTSDSYNIPLDFYVDLGKDVFGEQYDLMSIDDAVDRSYVRYGGTDMEASHVMYVNGELDPWGKLGMTETKSKDNIAINIPGASHSDDMRSAADHPELVAAQTEISKTLMTWCSE